MEYLLCFLTGFLLSVVIQLSRAVHDKQKEDIPEYILRFDEENEIRFVPPNCTIIHLHGSRGSIQKHNLNHN